MYLARRYYLARMYVARIYHAMVYPSKNYLARMYLSTQFVHEQQVVLDRQALTNRKDLLSRQATVDEVPRNQTRGSRYHDPPDDVHVRRYEKICARTYYLARMYVATMYHATMYHARVYPSKKTTLTSTAKAPGSPRPARRFPST